MSRQEQIGSIIVRLLEQRARPGRPGPDDDLRQAGISSLDMVKVVLALEQSFAVAIPDEAITPKNFRSISSIDALLGTLVPA